MNSWIVRGLGMTFVHVATRVMLGIAVTAWPLHGSLLRWLGILVVVVAAAIWAGIDGVRDARAHPSEREETDLTMTWLKAAAVTGLLSGAVCWVIGTASDIALGENSLFFELTSGAAFTLLLVFVPAMFATAVGRFLGHRGTTKPEERDTARASAATAPVAATVGTTAAGDTNAQWSHEEDAGAYGFAEGPFAGDTSTEALPAQADTQGGRHHGEDVPGDDSTDTEVFRAVRPPNE
ncbi:B-4DMT family transporter [Rhodococcus sp. NPDC003318]|uniref:B-4DMT family transporter n=1 Tax=Rhodococcus sp. NPDC003318 TaxID=3364503 RepID=UPI0036A74D52